MYEIRMFSAEVGGKEINSDARLTLLGRGFAQRMLTNETYDTLHNVHRVEVWAGDTLLTFSTRSHPRQ